jgi:hypothetical protein
MTKTLEDKSFNPFNGNKLGRLLWVGRADGHPDQATTMCPLLPMIRVKTADVNALIEIAKALNSNSSVDLDLGDNKWSKTSSVKSCGIRISNHDFVSYWIIVKVTASVLSLVLDRFALWDQLAVRLRYQWNWVESYQHCLDNSKSFRQQREAPFELLYSCAARWLACDWRRQQGRRVV